MKINYYIIACLYFSFLALIPVSCAGKEKRSIIDSINKESTTSTLQTTQSEMKISQKATENSSQQKITKTDTTKVDTIKIHDESDVTRAISPQSDAEAIAFCIKNFKFPTPIPKIKGTILTDMVIEKDGAVSDVVIVRGLHPDLDKETIRVLKLMPKFVPGKLNGKPVRSKYRMSMSISYRESK